MTNTAKLQGKMREKGFTIKALASFIGLTTTGLFNKIHNKREFLISEAHKIGIALSLSDDEVRDIFFAKEVESNSIHFAKKQQIEGV